MKRIFLLLLLAVGFAAGCQQASTSSDASSDQKPEGTTSGSAPAGTKTEEMEGEAKIPDELQTPAYHWYGLNNTKPIHYRATLPKGVTYEGDQTCSFKEMKDGKALFTLDRTEGLEQALGDETIELAKDAVYTLGSTAFTNSIHSKELPAEVKAGQTWDVNVELKMQGNLTLKNTQHFKIVGPESVKTPTGSHDALKIVSTGEQTFNGTTYAAQSQYWYVRDHGLVKSISVLKAKGQSQTITVEETPAK